jgi:hypothetical protein
MAADALVVENKSIQSPILSRHVFSNAAAATVNRV